MKHIIRDYLSFSKRERNGVFVLLSIITMLLIWLNISDQFQENKKTDVSKFERELDSLNTYVVNSAAEDLEDRKISLPKPIAFAGKPSERFDFDPNDLPVEEWRRLGFSEKQIKMIKNYESKGGKFRKKEDLAKMYCIKKEQFMSLESYIHIPAVPAVFENGKVENPKLVQAEKKLSAVAIVELNAADSAQLTTIKGIGPFYAKTIIKYRNSVGGFYAKEQLMEVWKFDREKYNVVEKYITVDPSLIHKININSSEADQLKGVYLNRNAANAIVNYRKQHGKFKSIEDIKLTDLVDDETLRKIAPYLTIGDL